MFQVFARSWKGLNLSPGERAFMKLFEGWTITAIGAGGAIAYQQLATGSHDYQYIAIAAGGAAGITLYNCVKKFLSSQTDLPLSAPSLATQETSPKVATKPLPASSAPTKPQPQQRPAFATPVPQPPQYVPPVPQQSITNMPLPLGTSNINMPLPSAYLPPPPAQTQQNINIADLAAALRSELLNPQIDQQSTGRIPVPPQGG